MMAEFLTVPLTLYMYNNWTCPNISHKTFDVVSTPSGSNWGKGVKSFVVCKLIIASNYAPRL